MTKQGKTFAIVGVSLAVLVGLYLLVQKASAQKPKPAPEPTPEPAPSKKCPEGQVRCPMGENCFDPNINYLVNPCVSKKEYYDYSEDTGQPNWMPEK